jgi:hypothetical protein
VSPQPVSFLKQWWFWAVIAIASAFPTNEFGGATGDHYDCGIPFPSWYVKHGNMGIGGTLKEGILYIPDGSPRLANGVRSGWFIQAVPLGIALDVGCWLLLIYGVAYVRNRVKDAKQSG